MSNNPFSLSEVKRIDMFQTYRSSASDTIFLPTFEKIYMHHMIQNLDKENEYTQKMLNYLEDATEQLERGELSPEDLQRLNRTVMDSPIKGEATIYDELVKQGYSFLLNNKDLVKLWNIKNPYIHMPIGEVW